MKKYPLVLNNDFPDFFVWKIGLVLHKFRETVIGQVSERFGSPIAKFTSSTCVNLSVFTYCNTSDC
ncbi:hypothetical protein D3C71_1405500 [compost metagenome]